GDSGAEPANCGLPHRDPGPGRDPGLGAGTLPRPPHPGDGAVGAIAGAGGHLQCPGAQRRPASARAGRAHGARRQSATGPSSGVGPVPPPAAWRLGGGSRRILRRGPLARPQRYRPCYRRRHLAVGAAPGAGRRLGRQLWSRPHRYPRGSGPYLARAVGSGLRTKKTRPAWPDALVTRAERGGGGYKLLIGVRHLGDLAVFRIEDGDAIGGQGAAGEALDVDLVLNVGALGVDQIAFRGGQVALVGEHLGDGGGAEVEFLLVGVQRFAVQRYRILGGQYLGAAGLQGELRLLHADHDVVDLLLLLQVRLLQLQLGAGHIGLGAAIAQRNLQVEAQRVAGEVALEYVGEGRAVGLLQRVGVVAA